jgi:hypothetical protein
MVAVTSPRRAVEQAILVAGAEGHGAEVDLRRLAAVEQPLQGVAHLAEDRPGVAELDLAFTLDPDRDVPNGCHQSPPHSLIDNFRGH